MRMYSTDIKKKMNKVTLYLTPEEAQELKDSLENLLSNAHHHEHVPDDELKREITVCLYKTDDLSGYDQLSKNLILNDE